MTLILILVQDSMGVDGSFLFHRWYLAQNCCWSVNKIMAQFERLWRGGKYCGVRGCGAEENIVAWFDDQV